MESAQKLQETHMHAASFMKASKSATSAIGARFLRRERICFRYAGLPVNSVTQEGPRLLAQESARHALMSCLGPALSC